MFRDKFTSAPKPRSSVKATSGIALCPATAGCSRRLFCTLKYRPATPEGAKAPGVGKAVLLVVQGGKGELAFYVSPDVWGLASGAEFLYLYDFLLDLPRRAKRYPDLLFQQLCALSVGPLITQMVGVDGDGDRSAISACAEFVSLDSFAESGSPSLPVAD